jgi:hypothetical protein
MTQTTINGGARITAGTITLDRLVAGYSIPTGNLADGANFIKRDGSVAFTADQSAGGFKLTNLAAGVAGTDAINLTQAQSLINGLGVSKRARTLVTTNVTLSGVQNFDGVTGVAGDIVWLNGQSTGSQNGFWTMNVGAWTRPVQWAAASSQKSFLMFIEQGTTYGDTKWTILADAITVDTTSVTAVQDTSGSTYTNGNGLSLTGNVFAVKLLSTGGISFDGSQNLQIALDGSNLSVSASGLKIANSGSNGQVMIGNASNVATFTTLTGDIASITGAGAVTLASTVMKSGNYIVNELPTGTVNGTNPTFTLANTPIAGTQMVFSDGLYCTPGAGNDYTISGTTLTMLGASIPTTNIRVTYLR